MKLRAVDQGAIRAARAETLGARTAFACACLLVIIHALGASLPSAHALPLAQTLRIEGEVFDQAGAPVKGARVTVRAESSVLAELTTGGDGRFVFEALPRKPLKLRVTARGFAVAEKPWNSSENRASFISITLMPAPVLEVVAVTATRTETRLADTAASVVLLSATELAATAAATIDDALRQVPGFQLFRRSGSRTANPTSQGVSLRGVGASGASRALVLEDGLPLNDPFGGWVYWGRVPRESVASVEVLRGGSSNLYGSTALGGVVHILTRRPADEPVLSLEASYGNERTADLSLFAGGRRGRWGATLAAESFRTDGYVLVKDDERGPIDTLAGSLRTALDLSLERRLRQQGRIFLRAAYFVESRTNGTPMQTNRTHIRQLSAGADWPNRRAGAITLRVYTGTQLFDQNFSAVSADRTSETLTRVQRVPVQATGLSTQWSRALGRRQTIVAGLDAREVRGASDELVFAQNRPQSLVAAGGRERTFGLFAEDIVRLTERLFVTGGVRFDRWRNYSAFQATAALRGGVGTVNQFADRTERAFSPQLSVLYKPTESVSLNVSAYRAFRQPTLNELYRSFRVGDAVTLANENLRAERLTGAEAGAGFSSPQRRMSARSTFFWTETTRPIANVTLSATPALITRRRENLGRTRSRGLELEAEARLGQHWSLTGGYLFSDATVRRFPANPELEGLLIPQVARHQLSFQARYSNPSLLVAGLQARFAGAQYDDDQNRFRLGRYFTLDALASRRLARGLELFAAAENLFNQRYEIGRTPVTTLGPPVLLRFGLRLRLGRQQ
ncbi:MAG TPA: TonB-dependent receptor [Pyrinomonadaceae bacterium]|jgi:outer membrane receptor protein involved in Fe transport